MALTQDSQAEYSEQRLNIPKIHHLFTSFPSLKLFTVFPWCILQSKAQVPQPRIQCFPLKSVSVISLYLSLAWIHLSNQICLPRQAMCISTAPLLCTPFSPNLSQKTLSYIHLTHPTPKKLIKFNIHYWLKTLVT